MTITRWCTSTWVAASPMPGRGVHGLEHVIDQRAESGVKTRHRLRTGAQSRVGKFEDGS